MVGNKKRVKFKSIDNRRSKKFKVSPRARAFAKPLSPLSELGNYDNSLVSQCTTTGYVAVLNTIVEGDTKSNRHGNRIVMKSIEMKWYIYAGASQTIPQAYVGALIYDKQPNGALPAVTDLWTSATSLAFKNLDNSHRFVFLKKIEGFMPPIADDPDVKEVNSYLKLDLPTFYDANAGAITDITTGSLLLFILGDQAFSDGTHPLIRLSCRLRYQS